MARMPIAKTSKKKDKLWGGRFKKPADRAAELLTESITLDQRLHKHDILGSIAHATMLAECGIISKAEKNKIIKGLRRIQIEMASGKFNFRVEQEDIHTAVELSLAEKIGPTAKKLHTARSRNDQVALDLRLWMRDEISHLIGQAAAFQEQVLNIADDCVDVPVAALTHLQHAQPVPLAHHLLAYVEMLERDKDRLSDCFARISASPLGACAVAGTSIRINREFTAKLLGFDKVTRNSIDTVSDRDFCIEFLSVASILAMHLSRLAEEWTLWSGDEFGYIDIDEAFCTGSSIMPQKKNPDSMEIIRGKSGRVFGHLIHSLTVMKAQPLAYNRDLQEITYAMFDASDTLRLCFDALIPLSSKIKINKGRVASSVEDGLVDSTSLAEYLVIKGVPFRDAHEIVGKLVKKCIREKKKLAELDFDDFAQEHPLAGRDVYEVLGVHNCLRRYRGTGCANPKNVRRELAGWRRRLAAAKRR